MPGLFDVRAALLSARSHAAAQKKQRANFRSLGDFGLRRRLALSQHCGALGIDNHPAAQKFGAKSRIAALRRSEGVVYAKPPFGGPGQVLAYLARYTHRAAIANSRLLAVGDNEVAFAYKD